MGINDFIQIGSRIKRYRKANGISQKDMANKIGLAISTYSNYENNLREPGIETIKKIATELGVSVNDLIGSTMSQEEIEKESILDSYLLLLGYNLIYDDENGYICITSADGTFEISEGDIEELQKSTESFFKFKLNEILTRSRKIGK